ncbi:MAG TPA: CBASS oligonucleotide cyclase [Gemmatimonadales bacterium]|nr:CBASS oligonucleotide cyclase [Gemmatimonadales bacterium]
MITVTEAFRKFRTRLELTDREQADASRRQKEIRELLAEHFAREEDFLSGSYARYTKTKPLKDVDIVYVLHDDERGEYRTGHLPGKVLSKVEAILVDEYGRDNVRVQRRSVSVQFPATGDDERVVSFDVVPAFTRGDHYEIPDTSTTKGWTETNPRTHAEKATAANEAYGGEWKGMVRMLKRWNQEHDKPIKPSFLIEVMALQILRPPFNGNYPYEFMGFFATAKTRILEDWADPAGLGPPVSDSMTPAQRRQAADVLAAAANAVRDAIQLGKAGREGDALRAYRALFGDLFPLS